MKVHVYRNRRDDRRLRSELHFCIPCGGWYGVPHDNSHCQQRKTAVWGFTISACACRFCREESGRPVEGSYGFFTEATRWQPQVPLTPSTSRSKETS